MCCEWWVEDHVLSDGEDWVVGDGYRTEIYVVCRGIKRVPMLCTSWYIIGPSVVQNTGSACCLQIIMFLNFYKKFFLLTISSCSIIIRMQFYGNKDIKTHS